MDISRASLSSLPSPSRADSLAIPFTARAAAAGGAGASSAIPLDPSTGFPLITSGAQIELIAARALYAWNLQVIGALRGDGMQSLAFSSTSLSSVNTVQALIQGASYQDASRAADSAAPYGGSLGEILGYLLDYFSPAASALRMAGYGLDLLGGGGGESSAGGPSSGDLSALLLPALAAGSAAGGGAPSAVIIALNRTESFSLQALDLYAEGYTLPGIKGGTPLGGYGKVALSTLNVDYSSETSFLGIYFGPSGAGEYSPTDLYA